MPAKPLGARGTGVTSDEVRRHNLALVLDRVHRSGSASRSSLTASTGLNRSTVRHLVGALAELGFVEEGQPEIDGPGRPSPMVTPIPQSAIVVACAVNVYSLEVAAIGLAGHFFARVLEPSPFGGQSPDETVARIAEMASRVLGQLPHRARVIGAGVSVTGVVRPEDGLVRIAPNLGWVDVPLGPDLEAVLGIPVTLTNDADAGALAEHMRGAATAASDILYVSGEDGIGIGVISDGLPFGGASGYAGEAGHMVVNPAGIRCGCGARGCWETEAGEAALLRSTGTVVETDGLAALADLERRAMEGDPRALDGIADVSYRLGIGLGSLINIFNPELVVLGGFFNTFYRWMADTAREAIASQAITASLTTVDVVASALGDDAPLVGAAEIALAPFLADPGSIAG
jgi:predicted NBD/HSP70 family sugar kinase